MMESRIIFKKYRGYDQCQHSWPRKPPGWSKSSQTSAIEVMIGWKVFLDGNNKRWSPILGIRLKQMNYPKRMINSKRHLFTVLFKHPQLKALVQFVLLQLPQLQGSFHFNYRKHFLWNSVNYCTADFVNFDLSEFGGISW